MKKAILLYSFMLFVFSSWGQWSSSAMPTEKVQLAAIGYGNSVWFGGGATNTFVSNKIEIYNRSTGEWTQLNLSVARIFAGATAGGGKVFFAGGVNFGNFQHYSRVDIIDTATLTSSTHELSAAKFAVAAVSHNNKVYFAGGVNVDLGVNDAQIDILDLNTNTWSVDMMTYPGGVRAVVSGDDVVFVGDHWMDIFHTNNNTRTSLSLPENRGLTAVVALNNEIIIAGGEDQNDITSDRVDIYNLSTGQWSLANLSEPRSFLNSFTTVCGKAYFAGGGTFHVAGGQWTTASSRVDIYDANAGTWATDELSNAVVNHAVASSGNQLFSAGGYNFTSVLSNVDIFTCQTNGLLDFQQSQFAPLPIIGNPVRDVLKLDGAIVSNSQNAVQILNVAGQIVLERHITENEIDVQFLPSGLYIIKVLNRHGTYLGKFFKE